MLTYAQHDGDFNHPNNGQYNLPPLPAPRT
jgi:hypothetical protein